MKYLRSFNKVMRDVEIMKNSGLFKIDRFMRHFYKKCYKNSQFKCRAV